MINKFAASQLYAGLTRAVLAAALISASLAASIGLPAPRQAALPDPLRVVQRILPDEFEAQPIENAEAGERPSSPDGAAAFRRKQLVNEKGEIPLEAPAKAAALYETARMRTRLSPAPNAAGITPGAWTFEGPTNTGGRIRSIVAPTAHPDWLVIGSVGGGTWINKNDGNGWIGSGAVGGSTYINNLAVTTIVADPVLSGTLYAGTGEGFNNVDALRGDGVFKSTDSGQTWSQLASTKLGASTSFSYVNRLAMTADGAVLLAGTGDSLQRSIDGGATWTPILGAEILDVKAHPTVFTQVLVSGDGFVSYSLDAGVSWEASTGFPGTARRIEVAWSRSNPNIAFASVNNNNGEVYRSTDAGATFTLVNTGQSLLATQGFYDNVIWVNPVNPNDIVVGGVDVYRSTNGGTTFTMIGDWSQYATDGASVHADHHAIVSAPGYNGVTTKTMWFGNDAGLFRVDDLSLASVLTGYTHIVGPSLSQFYGVGVSSGGGVTRVVGGLQDNGSPLQIGLDGWTDLNGGDGGFVAIDQTDSNFIYVEYVFLEIARSTDGGASMATDIDKPAIGALLDSRSEDTALFIAPFILDPNNSNTLLAGGASLWRSTNVSDTVSDPFWSAIKAPVAPGGSMTELISAIAVAPGNSNAIWVGHERGAIYRTSNGTAVTPTWTVITATELPTKRFLTRLVVDPINPLVIYATYGGYSANNVWKTSNGGLSWTALPGAGLNALPEVPVRTLAVHPTRPAYLYAGTEVGIFASADGGATWSVPADGPVNVSVDELVWHGGRLYAATHGRGLWSIVPSLSQPRAYLASLQR